MGMHQQPGEMINSTAAASIMLPHGVSGTDTNGQSNLYLPPRLVIIKQGALSEEAVVKDGITSSVYVVIKSSPFQLELALEHPYSTEPSKSIRPIGSFHNKHPMLSGVTVGAGAMPPPINLKQFTFDVQLIYDNDDEDSEEKEVDFLSTKPLESKIHVHETGQHMSAECRLKVLTSHREDRFFRLRFLAFDSPEKEQEVSPLLLDTSFARSGPIKVLSKPEQGRKKKKHQKKRTLNDMLMDTLNRIEKHQQSLINKLNSELNNSHQQLVFQGSSSGTHPIMAVAANSNLSAGSSSAASVKKRSRGDDNTALASSYHGHSLTQYHSIAPMDEAEMEDEDAEEASVEPMVDFETAFRQLLRAYSSMSAEVKVAQMRSALQLHDTMTTSESVAEMNDLFAAEGLERQASSSVMTALQHERLHPQPMTAPSLSVAASIAEHEDCHCEGCPHKEQLENVESFLKEVFTFQGMQ